jgi:DNA-binding transcriptional regulator YiaG
MAKGKAAPKKRAPKKHRVSRSEGATFVRGIRRKLKMTQAAFAARLGVAQMTVSRWEAGEAPLRPSMRLAVAAVVGAVIAEREKAKARKAAKAR